MVEAEREQTEMVEVWRRNRVGTVKRTTKKRVVQRLQWEGETVGFFGNLELKAMVGNGQEIGR